MNILNQVSDCIIKGELDFIAYQSDPTVAYTSEIINDSSSSGWTDGNNAANFYKCQG